MQPQVEGATVRNSMTPKPGSTEGIILSYVNEKNRPLNTQVIADALQNHGIKKSAVQKVLDTLCDSGTISFKDFGKQKIYLANQDQFEIPSMEKLDQMKKENARLQQELADRKTIISGLETELHSIETNLTDSQIKDKVEKLTDEITEKKLKVTKLKAGIILVTPEEKKEVEESYAQKVLLWRKRKRIFKELWDRISDAVPNNLSELKEELGIETDDDLGIRFEDHSNLAVKKQRQK